MRTDFELNIAAPVRGLDNFDVDNYALRQPCAEPRTGSNLSGDKMGAASEYFVCREVQWTRFQSLLELIPLQISCFISERARSFHQNDIGWIAGAKSVTNIHLPNVKVVLVGSVDALVFPRL